MGIEVEPGDWEGLDPWWAAYTQARPISPSAASDRVLDVEWLADKWNELDPWWRVYADSSPVIQAPASDWASTFGRSTDAWDELEPWWDVYAETGHDTAVELANLLDRSNKEWRQSEAPFDTDPLAADLTLNRFQRGPLQPSNEVEWSQWLARLLRPSAELVGELFDVEVDQSPDKVVREEQLSKRVEQEGSFRRPDILVFHADRGVSIEVKLDDENYPKRPRRRASSSTTTTTRSGLMHSSSQSERPAVSAPSLGRRLSSDQVDRSGSNGLIPGLSP
ncbi:hypothetical protein ACFQE8_07185 [Salinirubellus sp. GCM10025818]|uniref:hypothetical protein n=1 Tax=Salinirubellus TaxID=2162630 RepID=UPI0030D61F4D